VKLTYIRLLVYFNGQLALSKFHRNFSRQSYFLKLGRPKRSQPGTLSECTADCVMPKTRDRRLLDSEEVDTRA